MNKKQVIRINETQLKRIVNESVKRVLKEGTTDRNIDAMWSQAQEMMGADAMLDALYAYLDADTIEGFIQTLRREYEIPFYED